MAQMGFYINMAICIGCKTCVVACKDKNDLEVGRNYRRVYDFEEGEYPNPAISHLSISCNHCEEPKCVEGCPTGAMYKRAEDGVVLVDHDKCVGCKYCQWNCPYSGPQYNEELGKMTKCDTCIDLREKGEEPACVTSCPMRAIEFGPIEELRKKYGDVNEVKGMPSASITKPNIVLHV
ncbi:DMSO/selenate family reductase complex B subunit [Bacillus sp. V33-4]|uniref:DMSO/selenate family reductase complex B subunit n=1 Tax=Bacillus sp. V33-4 TaxID=2054169 RepID=UPI000C7660C0|nr:DMSO/selenate family reductase complex B subunit [Bacillus sp. V33-4]PLR84867.1 dimethylsulfoxide reductase, chain B [Bacillus sp. V33-4]